jgi:hypothetical protein
MHTLISAFEDRAGAQRTVERLHELGFAPDDVHLQEYRAPGADKSDKTDKTDKGDFNADRGVLSSYGHAFASMFGLDTPDLGDAEHYASAHRAGHPLVMVSAEDDDRADIAGHALQQAGAIDVHQRAGVPQPADAKHRGVFHVSRVQA